MKLNFPKLAKHAMSAIVLAVPTSVSADAVTDWNAIAVQATVNRARPGQTGIIDVAMVHVAIHDGRYKLFEKRYEPYYVEIPGITGSPEAAAAKAAHDVLVSRFPAQTSALDTTYQQYLPASWSGGERSWRKCWSKKLLPASFPCVRVTGVSLIQHHLLSSAAPASASGARHLLPTCRCSRHGWVTSHPSHSHGLHNFAPPPPAEFV